MRLLPVAVVFVGALVVESCTSFCLDCVPANFDAPVRVTITDEADAPLPGIGVGVTPVGGTSYLITGTTGSDGTALLFVPSTDKTKSAQVQLTQPNAVQIISSPYPPTVTLSPTDTARVTIVIRP